MKKILNDFMQHSNGVSIVASTTGVGKTTFLVQLSVELAQYGKNVLFITSEMYRHAIIKKFDKNISRLKQQFLEKNVHITEPINPSEFEDKIQEVIESGFKPDVIVFDASFTKRDELLMEVESFSTIKNIPFWVCMQVNIKGYIDLVPRQIANLIVLLEKADDYSLNAFTVKNRYGESSSTNSKKLFFDRNNCLISETQLEIA